MPATEKTAGQSHRTDNEPKSPAPSISLPKGGGAIRGIGEKFAANPVTGTGSMGVPIATSRGAQVSVRNFRSPMTPAPATALLALAGRWHCPPSPARPTRACRSIGMPRSPMSSSTIRHLTAKCKTVDLRDRAPHTVMRARCPRTRHARGSIILHFAIEPIRIIRRCARQSSHRRRGAPIFRIGS